MSNNVTQKVVAHSAANGGAKSLEGWFLPEPLPANKIRACTRIRTCAIRSGGGGPSRRLPGYECNRLGYCPRGCVWGCKSRPNWIREVNGEGVILLPFSTTLVSPLRFERGEGGLAMVSYLQPRSYTISFQKIGPVIGWLDPQDLVLRVLSSVPNQEFQRWFQAVYSDG